MQKSFGGYALRRPVTDSPAKRVCNLFSIRRRNRSAKKPTYNLNNKQKFKSLYEFIDFFFFICDICNVLTIKTKTAMKQTFNKGLKVILLSLFFYFSQPLFAWDELTGTDVRSLALGQVVALSHTLSNPSGISFLDHKEVSLSFYHRFELKELNTQSVCLILPNKRLDAGIDLTTYGYSDYRLISGNTAISKKIHPKLALGASFAYLYQDSFLEEKPKHFIQAAPGIFWQINSRFELAFVARNLIDTRPSSKRIFHGGINFYPVSDCTILAEISSDFDNRTGLALGFEYLLIDALIVRGGFRSDHSNAAIGAGWIFQKWKIEATFMLHDRLGLSSAIGASYSF